jgi:hypothetical protein
MIDGPSTGPTTGSGVAQGHFTAFIARPGGLKSLDVTRDAECLEA